MFDFENATFAKMKPVPFAEYEDVVRPVLVEGEEVLHTFRGMRDGAVFTSKRVISINVQGTSGRKKRLTSLPYRNIQAFSAETAGGIDLDCEMELWAQGFGKMKLEFVTRVDMLALCQTISQYLL